MIKTKFVRGLRAGAWAMPIVLLLSACATSLIFAPNAPIALFDGLTLSGWQVSGKTNWRVDQKSLLADAGEDGFLVTTQPPFKTHPQLRVTGTETKIQLYTPSEDLSILLIQISTFTQQDLGSIAY